MPDIRVFITTIGEKILFDSIAMLKSYTPDPFKITIWYDACGRGVDDDFVESLRSYTDDIIVSHENKTLAATWAFALLYLKYDFLILTCPDSLPREDYFQRIMEPFRNPKVGLVGNINHHDADGTVISDFAKGPDSIFAIRREAVNACGGYSPSFNGRGPFQQEIYRRMARRGWDFAGVKGLLEDSNACHAWDLDDNWKSDLDKDNQLWSRLEKKDYRNYNWWSDAL